VDDSLLLAGEFLLRTRLSPKALRLYEDSGLIRPADVDPRTGYRRYAPEQVGRARLIGLLRRAGMPLARVRDVVDLAPGARRAALEGWWASVESDVRERRELVRALSRPTEEEVPVHDVTLRPVEAADLLTAERRLTVDRLPAFIADAAARIEAHLAGCGATATGPLRVIYHGMVTEDGDGPVEVAVPFTGTVPAVDDLRVRRQAAGSEACTALSRRDAEFPHVLAAYDAVGRWIDDEGLRRAGSPAEVYLTSREAAGTAPDAVHLEVVWPVGPA
jgi:DNA-binding transcriptional MerR regulator